ncbi:hypothetical protein FB451DRAFT_324316 [Mycena latifolia]|nr:hypothetical protein FB451DRAFT_324316 [Mycena latifolia]
MTTPNSQKLPEGFREWDGMKQLGYAGLAPTEEDAVKFLETFGATPEQAAAMAGPMFENVLKIFSKPIECVGLPPQPGDVDDIHFTDIPQDAHGLSIRFFPGGATIASAGGYFMDLYDPSTDETAPTPVGYEFYNHHRPGDLQPSGRLVSLEEAFGGVPVPGSTERFSVSEGALCELRRPEREPFMFTAPVRNSS